jgi:hypothetical protein
MNYSANKMAAKHCLSAQCIVVDIVPLIRIQAIIVQQKISLLNTSISFKNNKKSTMTFKEVPVAKS